MVIPLAIRMNPTSLFLDSRSQRVSLQRLHLKRSAKEGITSPPPTCGNALPCGSPEIVEGFLCRFRLGLGFPDLVVDGR